MLRSMAERYRVTLRLEELTDRQLHLHHIRLLEEQNALLKSLERHMADLQQSVSDLQEAVDGVNARVAGQVQSLTDALGAANQALADEALDDAAREAALTDALAEAQAAADAIQGQVEELNAIGAEPDVPVEPETPDDLPANPEGEPTEETPTEEAPEEAPAEESPTEEQPG